MFWILFLAFSILFRDIWLNFLFFFLHLSFSIPISNLSITTFLPVHLSTSLAGLVPPPPPPPQTNIGDQCYLSGDTGTNAGNNAFQFLRGAMFAEKQCSDFSTGTRHEANTKIEVWGLGDAVGGVVVVIVVSKAVRLFQF